MPWMMRRNPRPVRSATVCGSTGRVIGPDQGGHIADLDGLLLADVEDRMGRVHSSGDRVQTAVDQHLAGPVGLGRIPVRAADRQERHPGGSFGHEGAVEACAVARLEVLDPHHPRVQAKDGFEGGHIPGPFAAGVVAE